MYRELTAIDFQSLYPDWEMVKGFYKQKENNMVKDFIVAHDSYDGNVGIIMKSKIVAVKKLENGTARIITDYTSLDVSEKYEDIVKKLFK